MITKKILDQYFEKLEGPDGCDFKESEDEIWKWKCGGGNNKDKSTKILKELGLPTKEIVKVFSVTERCGGYCDCEILFNAVEGIYDHYGFCKSDIDNP